jgi:pilus assembly protein CpaC
VRIYFTPVLTPRGTIRMAVTPEVSSLDYSNALTIQGFVIPALSTRRVQTEIELENGQSFAIGGMLDNRVIENWSKIPGLGNIPFFGKLFRSQQLIRNNTELLVVVTPELVRPIPAGGPIPDIKFPKEFMEPNTSAAAPRHPGLTATGGAGTAAPGPTIPVEQLVQSLKPIQTQTAQPQQSPIVAPFVPLTPIPANSAPPSSAPASPSPPPAAPVPQPQPQQ